MFVEISNRPRDYDWGSDGRISNLLGRTPTGAPEAELWLGAHDANPARIDSDVVTYSTLDSWIRAEPKVALGTLTRLPYLLKVLAAGTPLSLQVHPTQEHAARMFAAEDALGIARDASERNYRDRNHKPELIMALEDGFAALCGIRPLGERQRIAGELGIAEALNVADMRSVFEDLLTHRATQRIHDLVHRVIDAAGRQPHSEFADAYRWVSRLAEQFPDDAGVVLSVFLNLVTLRAGEALYLPAGNLHAYLSGIGIEVMASSDNVLRGGLTSKHVDVPELLAVAEFEPLPVPVLAPEVRGDDTLFRGPAREFELHAVRGTATVELFGPAVALNLGSEATLASPGATARLDRGAACFITPDEQSVQVTGSFVVIAQPQAHWSEL